LARNPSKEKTDWPGFGVLYAESLCFACGTSHEIDACLNDNHCYCCPITEWRTSAYYEGEKHPCVAGKYGEWRNFSLFGRSFKNENLEKRSELALQISELEWEE
jgi:hypothetical protein